MRLQDHHTHRDRGRGQQLQEQGDNARKSWNLEKKIIRSRNNLLLLLQYAALEDWPNQIAGFLQDDIDDQVNLVIIRKL